MATLFARHGVGDYEAWRQVFDEYQETRKQVGVTSEAVYRSADNSNQITLVMEFESMEAARAFPDNQDLRTAYQRAGSVGTPTLWFAEKD